MNQPQFNYKTLWERIEREAVRHATSPQAVTNFINLISRRDFVKLIGAGAAAAAFGGMIASNRRATAAGTRAPQPIPARQTMTSTPAFPNGVASGDTAQTSTVLWARAAAVGALTFEVATDADFANIAQTLTVDVTDPMIPAKIVVDDLTPNTPYVYRVTNADGDSLNGRFRTAAESGTRAGLRFGVSGDWRGELRPYVALSNAPARDLAFFVEHGDTIYSDIPSVDFTGEQAATLEEFRVKHNEVYSDRYDRNFWADVRASTSILATIDDHEVTNDFAGGASPSTDERFADETTTYINETALYRNGLQTFQEYNPLRDLTYAETGDARVDGRPMLYRYLTYGDDAAVIVLDARSFRDANQAGTLDIFNREAIAAYLASLFAEGRTFLGRPQVEMLKRDLLAAHEAGIVWKFVMIPEPAQQTGWFGGEDRWEGFAPERTEVMQFIEENAIRNVVFVAADVHTTFINDIQYQTEPGGDNIPTHAFEISTGSLGFYPPTGQALVEGARDFGLVNDNAFAAYQAATLEGKDGVLQDLFNRFVLGLQGYTPLGLEESLIDATFQTGGYVLGHSFGWTEFDIAAETGVLTVTTYGVPGYDRETLEADPAAIIAMQPAILSQFTVNPQTA
jgi:phosphodiesterase/alkaline phosphatase D-like protein